MALMTAPTEQPAFGAAQPARPAPPFRPAADPTNQTLLREYVAGGKQGAWSAGTTARTLSTAIDDITGDFGDDLYHRMLHDPQVFSCVAILKAATIEQGAKLQPAVSEKTSDDYDLSREIMDEAELMLAELDTPLPDVLWNLLDCMPFGNKVAEQVYEYAKRQKDGSTFLRLQRLKVKPRQSTAFVVDQYLNLVGLMAIVPGVSQQAYGTIAYGKDGTLPDNVIPASKFAIASFRPEDGDPRGSSILRAAYSPWWRKQQIIPEYIKYLSQFAGPSIAGFTAPEASDVQDPDKPNDPTAKITAQEVMLRALMAFKNGSAAAFPNGASIREIVMQGNGEAFLRALSQCDQQITKAILTQELATEQSQNQARAAAEVHQEVLDTLVRQAKQHITGILRQQVLQPWVEMNWGPDARHLAPTVGLGESEHREMPALIAAVAQLMAQDYFEPEQLPGVDRLIGVPPREKVTVLPRKAPERSVSPGPAQPPSPAPASPPDNRPSPVPPTKTPAPTPIRPRSDRSVLEELAA